MMLVIKIRSEFYHRAAARLQEFTSPNITIDVPESGVFIGLAACCMRETGVLSGILRTIPSAPPMQCRAANKTKPTASGIAFRLKLSQITQWFV